jgi:hypothetical protein
VGSAYNQNESSISSLSAEIFPLANRRNEMITMTKKMLGAGAAAAALVSMAAPAQARDYYDRDRDGISAGEVIAGAVILGGIAAVLTSGKRNDRYDDRGYDRGYDRGHDQNNGYDRGYGYDNRYGGSRSAVNQCVSGVENYSNRYNRSKVTEIRDIQRTYNGYKVSGKLVVQESYRDRGGDRYDRYNRYDRGNGGYDNRGYDNRGYNRGGYDRGYEQGRFTCYIERGRVVDIQYRGLDQWR